MLILFFSLGSMKRVRLVKYCGALYMPESLEWDNSCL